jgi:ATP-dependent exoDNAse (exonuclease V) beta subunit
MSTTDITFEKLPHVLIRASAGSGKTYQLSNRYLDLLRHNAPPDTILATTFTRKAAGEILERILRRLALASTVKAEASRLGEGIGAVVTPESAQRMLASLCRVLHRVSVSTLDSFFNRIAHAFRHELGIPMDPRLVSADDPLAARVRAEAIDAMLGDSDAQVLIDLLRRLHHDGGQRRVTEAIDDIVVGLHDLYRATKAEHWHALRPGRPLERGVAAALTAQLQRLADAAPDMNFAKAINKARTAAERGAWDEFLDGGLAGAILACPGAPRYYKKPVTADQQAVYQPLIDHARAVLITRLAEQTAATYDLLARFDSHYTRLRDQHRVLLYSDLPHKLARELPQRGDGLLEEIYYRLDASIGHLLLDEFQDTSFEQWAVLRPFAQEAASHSDGSRSFFCVGDVKQAIYGWRGGRAEIFDRIENDLNLDPTSRVSLNVSFRSSAVVLDAVNAVFSSLGDGAAWKDEGDDRAEARRWASRFERHVPSRELPGHVEVMTSTAPEVAAESHERSDDDDSPMSEGHEGFVADYVARLSRSAPGRSIGVLVSRNDVAHGLIFRLRELRIDASAEGAGAITGDPAVDVVLSALRLADHPGHTAAAFHVVNSPLGAIVGLRSTTARECARVARTIRSDVLSLGCAPLLAEWARRLAPWCDPRSALRLTQLIELADRFEPDGSPRLRGFVEAVEAARIEDPSQAQVRVMTIHKAKGLEFDIVVLPELGRKIGALRSDAVNVDRDEATDEVRAVYRGTNDTVRALSGQVEAAYQQERMRRLRDDLCTLYVAMTRARQALHMVIEPLRRKKDGSYMARGWRDQSFAAVLRAALCGDVTEDGAGGQRLFAAGNEAWHQPTKPVAGGGAGETLAISRPTLRATPSSRRTWRTVAPSALHSPVKARLADLLDVKTDESRQRGTLLHAWCSRINWLDESGAGLPGDDELLEQAGRQCAKGADRRWAREQLAAFRGMIAQAGVVAALSRPVLRAGQTLELWRERPFVVGLGGNLLRGAFDRVVILREAGEVVRAQILDFKTDAVPGPTRMAELVEQYRPQVRAYREALALMLAIDAGRITARLLFLAAGQTREI